MTSLRLGSKRFSTSSSVNGSQSQPLFANRRSSRFSTVSSMSGTQGAGALPRRGRGDKVLEFYEAGMLNYDTMKRKSVSLASSLACYTIGEEPVETGWLSTPLLVRFVCFISACIEGYDIAMISATMFDVKREFNLTGKQIGLMVALPKVFAVGMPLISGITADRVGRKWTLAAALPLISISLTYQALARDFASLVIGRIFSSMAISAARTVTLLYVSEVAPAARRGAFTCMEDVLHRVGIFLAWIAIFAIGHGEASWRIAFMIGALAPLLFAIFMVMPIVPESPRYLHRCGRHEEARAVLSSLSQGGDSELELDLTLLTWDEMDSLPRTTLYNALTSKQMMIVCGVSFFRSCSGAHAISKFLLLILKLRVPIEIAKEWGIWINAVGLLAAIPPIWLLDTLGRRPLLLIGTIMVVPACLTIASGMYPSIPVDLMLVGLLMYKTFNTIGPGTAGTVYVVELLPLEAPGAALGVASVVPFVFEILSVVMIPIVLERSASLVFYFFALTNLLAFLFYYSFCPETKGLVLEHCQDALQRDMGASGSTAAEHEGLVKDP